jgi:hypothetical protein
MKKDTNPHLVKKLDNISEMFTNTVSITNYFKFTPKKKLTKQFLLLKFIIKSIINVKTKSNQDLISSLINELHIRSILLENYEMSELSKDLKNNSTRLFEMLNEDKPSKIIIKKPKTNNNENESKVN